MNNSMITQIDNRRSRGLTVVIILTAILTLVLGSETIAAGRTSARGVAMGEAMTGLAVGVDAARYNPANLGLEGYRQSGIELIGMGVNISNNAFTLGDYNRYTGAFLTDADKDDILESVPREGLTIVADVQASAMSLAMGSFVFSTTGVGLVDANINRDVIDLMFNGNSFADVIDLTGTYLDAIGYAAVGLSYGMPILRSGNRQVAVGATISYLRGLAVERIVELEGMVATYETGFSGNGRLIAQTATGGSGYALDVGAAARINNNYTVGISIKNFLSTLKWTQQTEEHGYLFSFDTVTVDNMSDDYVVSDDYTKDIPAFSTNLPSVMNVGLANTSGSLLWAINWEQGFRRAAGASAKPRLSLGLEWTKLGILPLRTGFATGGDKNTAWSFGSGLDLSPFHLDLAVVTGSSLTPTSSKGLNFAFSTGLHF